MVYALAPESRQFGDVPNVCFGSQADLFIDITPTAASRGKADAPSLRKQHRCENKVILGSVPECLLFPIADARTVNFSEY